MPRIGQGVARGVPQHVGMGLEAQLGYGPPTTIYNRFVRWARRGIWENSVPGACWERTIHRHADDRLHACQSAPLGFGRKRGEQKQAVGRSRGGRNTKIHALADAKGRLIAILLTGGEAHDCPVAERLIRRVKPPERMLGERPTTAPNCARSWTSAEPSRSFPTAATGNNRSLQQAPLQAALAHRECVQQVEGLQVHRHPLRQAGAKLLGLCLPDRRSCMVDLMSSDPS